jgi:hypothetical protein
MSLRSIRAVCAAGVLACPRLASAHSQIPLVRDIQFVPGDPSRIIVVSEAAGLFTSSDTGRTWSFVCSQSYAIDPYSEGVPPVALLEGGVIAVATGTNGLRLSADGGCNFLRSSDFDGASVVDAVSSDGASLHVLSYERFDEQFETSVRVSRDAGKTFEIEGIAQRAGIPVDLALASNSPDTRYVLERRLDPQSWTLRVSADGGNTWAARELPAVDGAITRARIAAVDPEDPAVLYVSITHAVAGSPEIEHTLWMSSTAGDAWGFLLASDTAIVGPVYDVTHTTVAFGSGGGVYRAGTGDLAAGGLDGAKYISEKPVFALAWSASGLYAGTNSYVLEPLDQFSVGVTKGDSGTFASVLSLCDLTPLSCAATASTGTQCGPSPHVLAEIRSSPICEPPGDAGAPAPPPSSAPDSGVPPRPTAPPPEGAPEASDASAAPAEVVRRDSGCSAGARAPGGRANHVALPASLAVLFSWLRKRRSNTRKSAPI